MNPINRIPSPNENQPNFVSNTTTPTTIIRERFNRNNSNSNNNYNKNL